MFIKVLILSAIFLSIAVAFLGIRIFLKTHGRFPETHISRNAEMRNRGITCAQQTDTGCHSSEEYPGCATCSGKNI